MNYTKGVRLVYDDSKDLSEGDITEIDDGVQYQVGYILPAFRDKYGKLFVAAPDMHEALKGLVKAYHIDEYSLIVNQDPEYWQRVFKALARADGKGG